MTLLLTRESEPGGMQIIRHHEHLLLIGGFARDGSGERKRTAGLALAGRKLFHPSLSLSLGSKSHSASLEL